MANVPPALSSVKVPFDAITKYPVKWRAGNSKVLIVGVVWSTLALDMLLYAVVVPILPKYIYDLEHPGTTNITKSMTKINSTNVTNSSALGCHHSTQGYGYNSDSISTIVGVLLALKQLVQVFCNFFVGPIVDKIGCDVPLFIGYFIIVSSSATFAFGNGYPILFIARTLQGIGSSFVTTSSFVVIANTFREERERRQMLGIAMCGMSVGLTIGPPVGAFLYEFGGKPAPFTAIGLLAIIVAAMQFCVRVPKIQKVERAVAVRTSYVRLVKDPYVLISALVIVLGNLATAFVEAALPLHMIRTMCSEAWMLGVIFLPLNGGFAVGTLGFGVISDRLGKWLPGVLSLIFGAIASVAFPFCKNLAELTGPTLLLGVAGGMLDVTAYPNLAHIVDTRIGQKIYGASYALGDVSFGLAYGLGPIMAGLLVAGVGFSGCMYFGAVVTILTLIPIGVLRKPLLVNPEFDDEETAKLVDDGVRHDSQSNGSLHSEREK